MAINTTAPARSGEVLFKQETTAGEAIATPSTYWPTSPRKGRFWDIAPAGLKRESEADQSMRPRMFADPPHILLGQKAVLTMKAFLHPLNQTASSGTVVTEDDFGRLLKGALGGAFEGTTRLVGAASGTGATTALVLNSTTGLTAGGAIRVNSECRRIVSVDSATNITTDMDFSAAPAQNDVCAAASTRYLDQDALSNLADANHLTFAALFRGTHAEDQWQLRGGSWEITGFENLNGGEAAKIGLTLHGLAWDHVTGVASQGAGTETHPAANVAGTTGGGLYVQATNTVTRQYRHTSSLSFSPGIARQEIKSPFGIEGIAGHGVFGGRSVLEFETFYDTEFATGYHAGTTFYGGIQLGARLLLTFPLLYISDEPERTNVNGVTGVKVKMHCDEGSVTTSDLTRSRFAIHRFPAA